MMPETSHQNDHFIQAIKDNDVTGIINSISSDVFDVNFRDVTHDLETPLMRLCHSGVSDEDMDAILQAVGGKNPDVDLQDAVGRTLTMHACIALRHQIVVFSLDQGCDASKCDRMGRSAYHYAAESGSDWIMASLLKQPDALGCLKVLDFKGYSPTDLARHRKAYTVVKMMTQAMSGNDNESNTRPFNPKPLLPAFMRTPSLEPRSPSKKQKQVTFNTDMELNNRLDSNLSPNLINNRSLNSPFTSPSKRTPLPLPHRGGNLADSDNNKHNNNNNGSRDNDNINDNGEENENSYVNNDDENDDDDDDEEDDGDDGNDNDSPRQNQTGLSPLKNTTCKENPDKLSGFTSSTPLGLIKPRPLPRLLTNQIKADTGQDNALNNYVTATHDPNTQAMDTSNNTPEPIPNDTPRKPTPNQNIFTLRPVQSNTPSNRTRLLAQEQNRADSASPTTDRKHKNLKEKNSNPPPISQRNKISLDLSLTSNPTKPSTPSPRSLGPVVSPRKAVSQLNGHRNVDALLNNTTNICNELTAKYKPKSESIEDDSSSKPDQPNPSLSNCETRDDIQDKSEIIPSNNTMTTIRQSSASSSKSATSENRLSKVRRQLPCRISTEGRRDLQAILSPVPTHRSLLQKRKPTDSVKSQCDALRGSYTVEDKHKDNTDKDNVFEEEIFLNADNGALKLGSLKPKGDERVGRSGSRMTIRRSSLSLPDLRDMTRCLVALPDKAAVKKMDSLGSTNTGNKDDNTKDNEAEDGDDNVDDNEDDKAEMEGDKSDDDDDDDDDIVVGCDLEDDGKNKRVSSTRAQNKGITFTARGGNGEIPLPSIQITNESNNTVPYNTRNGMAVPWK